MTVPPATSGSGRRGTAYRLMKWLQVCVTAGLVALLLSSVDWTAADTYARMFSLPWFMAALALIAGSLLCGALSLLVLFDPTRRKGGARRFILDYFHVQALSQFTPAQAGEMALPYTAGRNRFPPGEIAAGLVLQRMTSLAVLVGAALIGAGQWVQRDYLWAAALAGTVACATVIALIASSQVRAWLNRTIGQRVGPVLAGFHLAWQAMWRDARGALVPHAILMCLRFLLMAAAGWAAMHAFGVDASLPDITALMALATLAALIPVSLNGLGVTEGIFVAALTGQGHAAGQVLLACMAARAAGILVLLLGLLAHTLAGDGPPRR